MKALNESGKALSNASSKKKEALSDA